MKDVDWIWEEHQRAGHGDDDEEDEDSPPVIPAPKPL